MSKFGKCVESDWRIGAHTVNAYKKRVPDPAVRRKRRNAKDIRRVIAKALNEVKDGGKQVYLDSEGYRGNPKPKTLYRVEIFKMAYYVLCMQQQVVTLFSSDMIANDSRRGGLVFRDEKPFDELTPFFSG